MKSTPFVAVLVAFVLSFSGLLAAPSIRDYGSLPSVSMMVISPSGEKIAFRKVSDEKDSVLVVSLADGSLLNRLEIEEAKPRRLYFIGNDLLVLVASEHKGIWGSNLGYELSTAFGFDLKTGKLQQLLTPGDGILAGQSGLGMVAGVSRDFRYAYMPAFVGEEDSGANYSLRLEPGHHTLSLMKVDLESPRDPEVFFQGSPHSREFLVDEANDLVVEELFNGDSRVYSIRVYRAGKGKTLVRDESRIPEMSLIGFSADRGSVLISEDNHLRFVDLETGERSGLDFLYGSDSVARTILDSDDVIQGVVYEGFKPSYTFVDETVNERFGEIVAEHTNRSVRLCGSSSDWKRILVYADGNGTSGDYLLYTEGESPRLIAKARPNIASEDVHPIIEYEVSVRDGMTIPTLLTIPRSKIDAPSNLPAVMLPHGGPAVHDTLGFDWLAQALANRGYLVIQPQYRGSTGFGLAHKKAGRGEWGKKMQDDLTDCIENLVKRGAIDPDRIAIVGASYGGYAALAGAAFTPELYRCAVSINGVSDLPRMLDDERFKHGTSSWVADYWTDSMIGGEGGKKALREVSPVFSAEKVEAPVLLIHGKEDSVVPFDQAKAMQKALKKARKKVEFEKLNGEDHHLTRPQTRIQCLTTLVSFLGKHL